MAQANPRQLAVAVIQRVFQTQGYADLLLERALAQSNLDVRDKALATDLVYGTIRWQKTLNFLVQRQYRGDWEKLPQPVRWTLATALYQIMHQDRVPAYAVVSEAVDLAKRLSGPSWGGVVNGVLRNLIRHEASRQLPRIDDPVARLSLKWSHPEWLVTRWVETWGVDKAEALCRAGNQRPQFGLRTNRLKMTSEALADALAQDGVETRPSEWVPEMLVADRATGLAESPLFQDGAFTIQDESAALVARLVDPQPGDRLWDVAAAPGGKATHLAELSLDQADVVASDRHLNRLKLLRPAQNRLGLRRIFPILCDGRAPSWRRPFDKVLLDAPCSGLGVLRRRVELRWHRTPEEADRIVTVQRDLLTAVAPWVRGGGVLVYSTCTMQPEENEGVVRAFLANHPEYELEDASAFLPASVVTPDGMMRTWPDVHGADGAFAARLRRSE